MSNQMSRKLNEIKNSLSFQIQDAIHSAIAETVLPSIQNTLEMQGRDNFTTADRGSIGLHDSANLLISPRETEGPVGYNGTPK